MRKSIPRRALIKCLRSFGYWLIGTFPQQSRALSRKNILLRDRNTCQFCGRVFPSSELTLDHVVPRCAAPFVLGESCRCCYRCNNSKGDRTPEERVFKLARRPRRLRYILRVS